MSIDQLHSFVAVAEEGAILRAAVRLHITQPPLSRRILGLEDELGVPLFERLPRGMRLTPAGEAFLPRARQILELVDTAARLAREATLTPARADGPRPPTRSHPTEASAPHCSRSAPRQG